MKARVESMGGTTLEMIMPSTASMSSPAGPNRLCSRRPQSRAVCARTVRSRHWQSSLRPSKAPMVMLLLPASRASSTYASRKNQSIRSVVFAHDQEAGGVQAGGGPLDDAIRLRNRHAPAGGVARSARKPPEDGVLVQFHEGVDGRQQGQHDAGERDRGVRVKAQ